MLFSYLSSYSFIWCEAYVIFWLFSFFFIILLLRRSNINTSIDIYVYTHTHTLTLANKLRGCTGLFFFVMLVVGFLYFVCCLSLFRKTSLCFVYITPLLPLLFSFYIPACCYCFFPTLCALFKLVVLSRLPYVSKWTFRGFKGFLNEIHQNLRGNLKFSNFLMTLIVGKWYKLFNKQIILFLNFDLGFY